MPQLLIFILGSGLIIYLSRASLRAPRSHGFYRFFAWEVILALFLLNVDCWFDDPFSIHQLISWSLLIISAVLVAYGVYLLRLIGKPDDQRADSSLIGFEKTTTLVTVGVYRYIRHPLYSSLFFLAWGTFFKDPTWSGGILVLAASFFLLMTAKADEKECLQFFGPAYEAYMKRTKRFVPFVF